jgi:hypothetical protein
MKGHIRRAYEHPTLIGLVIAELREIVEFRVLLPGENRRKVLLSHLYIYI